MRVDIRSDGRLPYWLPEGIASSSVNSAIIGANFSFGELFQGFFEERDASTDGHSSCQSDHMGGVGDPSEST